MNTLLVVEAQGLYKGFQLDSHNFYRVPQGRIRIARYTYSFSPQDGRGYYGDIYFRHFIRKWKHHTATKRRLREKQMLLWLHSKINNDVLSMIGTFL